MRPPVLHLRLLLTLAVLLFFGAGTRALGKVSLEGEKPHYGDFFAEVLTRAGSPAAGTEERIRETASWSGNFAPDVEDGPNLYAYVQQNPWSKFDPHGLRDEVAATAKGVIDLEIRNGAYRDQTPYRSRSGDEQTAVVSEVGAGLIPVVGQIIDAKDTFWAIGGIIHGREGAWAETGFAFVGWMPGWGDAIKGGRKLAKTANAAHDLEKTGDAVHDLQKTGDAMHDVGKVEPPKVEVPEAQVKPSGGCFEAGTLVLTTSGHAPIESIRPGDEIRTCSAENKEPVSCRVSRLFIHEYSGEFVTITLNGGGKVTSTSNHPFRVLAGDSLASRPNALDAGPDAEKSSPDGARWVAAADLRRGDLTWTVSGPQTITEITSRFRSTTVYNLGVADLRTYLVGADSVLVHNKTMGDDFGGGGAPSPAPSSNKVAADAEAAVVPPTIYREGTPSPGNLTPRAVDEGNLSFRDSLSNPWPLPSGQRPVLRPGEPYIVVDTSKLPSGSVIPDNKPPGHVSVKDVPAPVVKDAVIDRGKLPK